MIATHSYGLNKVLARTHSPPKRKRNGTGKPSLNINICLKLRPRGTVVVVKWLACSPSTLTI